MFKMVKKVLMVAPFDTKGRFKGGIKYIVDSIITEKEYIENKNIEIETYDTCVIKRSKSVGGQLSVENIRNYLKLRKGIKEKIKATEYDTLYYHSSIKWALLKDLLIIRSLKKKNKQLKVVLHIHFAEYSKIMFSNRTVNDSIITILNKHVNKVIFLSDRTKETFVNHGLSLERTSCIYNFHTVNLDDISVNNKISNIIHSERINFTFMGSIDKRKGILDCLMAFKECDFGYKFNICGTIGNPNIVNDFNELVNSQSGEIIRHGYVSGQEKLNILLETDVLLLPSFGEGMPIVILEAMAAGCSIITTNVGAITEILKEENGVIIIPGDNKELSSSIIKLNKDRTIIKHHMEKNFAVSNQFSIYTFLDKVCSIL